MTKREEAFEFMKNLMMMEFEETAVTGCTVRRAQRFPEAEAPKRRVVAKTRPGRSAKKRPVTTA